MRRPVLLLTVVGAVLFACAGVALAQQDTPDTSQPAEDFAAGNILVKFKDRTSEAKKQDVHEKRGGQVKETIRGIGVQVVSVPDGREKSKAKEYKDDPNVEFAELNGVYTAAQTGNEPNDPRAPGQWQYKNTQYTEPKKGDIDAYEAWSGLGITWDGGTTGSSSVAIAILDTGIKEDHADLTRSPSARTSPTTPLAATSMDTAHTSQVAPPPLPTTRKALRAPAQGAPSTTSRSSEIRAADTPPGSPTASAGLPTTAPRSSI